MAAMPLLVGGLSVGANAAEGINILDNLQFKGEIRPRYEYADVKDNSVDAGQAFTARTKLVVSGTLLGVEGLTANVGVISVNNFGYTKYDSKFDYTNGNGGTLNPGSGKYDVIKDPQYAMISNADINYKVGKTLLHAGRSQVNLDNQRFIGTVGWRQLERSYDTVFVADNSVENLNLLAAWVYGFQGVGAGPTADTNTVLLHGSYKVMEPLTITAYDYMIANLADTYGIALTGKYKTNGVKLSYRAEYAQQNDPSMTIHDKVGTTKTSDIKADASYYNLDLGANISGVIVGANYEFLSGTDGNDGKTAFNPLLGTNHKFNGWADMFFVSQNPDGGLIDFNGRIGYKAKGFGKLLAVYHQFTADKKMSDNAGGKTDDLGSEVDFLYANKVPGVNNLSLLLKGALYSKGKANDASGDWTHDKTVYWAQLDYKFSTK